TGCGSPTRPAPHLTSLLPRGVVLDHELNVARDGNLGALRSAHEPRVELVELDVEVGGHRRQHLGVPTGGGHLERLTALAARLDVDELSGLDTERGAVDELS